MRWLRDMGLQFLIALFLSLVLWTFVTFTTNPDTTATYNNIPVEAVGLSPGLVIVNEEGIPRPDPENLAQVQATLETDRNTLASAELSATDLQGTVDLEGLGPGDHTVDINVDPDRSNIRLSSVSPEELTVRLEEFITMTVPISIELEGDLPFSYERDEPEVRASNQLIDQVQVSGPRSQVSRVDYAGVTISIDQLRATYVSNLQLEPRDTNDEAVEGVELAPRQVRVRIDIRPAVGVKRVPVLGQVEGTPAPGYVVTAVQSTPALIDLVGSSRLLDRIDHIETEPVNVSGATSIITQEVGLELRGAQPQADQPERVTVEVQIAPVDQQFEVQIPVPVQVVGAGDALLATIEPLVVEVPLQGSANAFQQLSDDTMIATVDIGGLGPGTYALTPQLALPDRLELAGDIPAVTVTLRVAPSPTVALPSPTATPAAPTLPTPQPGISTSTPPAGPEPGQAQTETPVGNVPPSATAGSGASEPGGTGNQPINTLPTGTPTPSSAP